MPAFIKTEKDEKVWSRAKSLVHKNYPDISEDSEDFWKITTGIYKKISGLTKKASMLAVLRKIAADATHTVVAGDRMVNLDKRYKLAPGSFEKANPGVNPRRMHIGTKLVIPSGNSSASAPAHRPQPAVTKQQGAATYTDTENIDHPMRKFYNAITEAETGSLKNKWIGIMADMALS